MSDNQPSAKEPQQANDDHGKDERAKDGKSKGKQHRKPKPALIGMIILAAMVLIIGGVLIWRHTRTEETTDDAFVDVVSEQVSAQIAGRVAHVLVNDNQDVKAGQLLVQIDPADFQSKVNQSEAMMAQAEAQKAQAQAQKMVYQAQVQEARSALGTALANATNADHQLTRYRALKQTNPAAVSDQQIDSLTATATSADAQVQSARDSIAAAQAQIGYADSMIKAADATIASAAAQANQSDLNLSYTQVKAGVNGQVTSKTVADGNVIAAGAPLMAIVPREVYITANFKETQLANMRRGQPVEIHVDSYPDLKLTGRIDSVQSATGTAFSVLPAQNATGNWVKVVQRIPVKIVFDHLPDDPDRRLSPGMSVEVSVKVR